MILSKGLLYILFIQLSFIAFSQEEVVLPTIPNSTEDSIEELMSLFINKDKAYGDTLWYEDFANEFSTNVWLSVDYSQNGLVCTTTVPGGQYSANTQVINSTTAANGIDEFTRKQNLFSESPNPSTGQFVLDLNHLEKGAYFILLQSKDISTTEKIIIE